MVYGPDCPYLKQKQKTNIKFWPTGFYLIYYFLLFEKNNIHSKLIQITLHKKLRFPLRISSVNVTKSAVSCIYLPRLFRLDIDYNHGHNIIELYNVLMQTRLTTSKTKRDIYYSQLGVRVASWVAKQLKT